MNIQEEREAFEAFASSQKWNIFRFPKSQQHDIDGQYVDEFVNGAWTGWVESKKHGAEKLDGCVVAPVELNEEAIYKINDSLAFQDEESVRYAWHEMTEAARGGNE